MVWQAAEREPDPLLTLVHAALRDCVFRGEGGLGEGGLGEGGLGEGKLGEGKLGERAEPGGFTAVPGERWRQAILPGGVVVRADLDVSPAWRRRHGPRACAEIRVTGALTVATAGYRIEAALLIDLATRAILSCEARPISLGA